MIRESKTFIVECDFCDAKTAVQVTSRDPDIHDAATEAKRNLGWKFRNNYDYVFDGDSYSERRVDYLEVLCSGDHPGAENRIGGGWS